jgi:hypothetical protein
MLVTPYAGLSHDAQAYAFQALARLDPAGLGPGRLSKIRVTGSLHCLSLDLRGACATARDRSHGRAAHPALSCRMVRGGVSALPLPVRANAGPALAWAARHVPWRLWRSAHLPRRGAVPDGSPAGGSSRTRRARVLACGTLDCGRVAAAARHGDPSADGFSRPAAARPAACGAAPSRGLDYPHRCRSHHVRGSGRQRAPRRVVGYDDRCVARSRAPA